MAGLFQVVIATDLEDDEFDDLKMLCIAQNVSIRQWSSEWIRRELRAKQDTITWANKNLIPRGMSKKEFIETKIHARGRGGKKPDPERLLDMTRLGDPHE